MVESNWTPPSLGDLPNWYGNVSIDTETCDPSLTTLGSGGGIKEGSFLVGVSFCLENGYSTYLPIRHEEGGNLPKGSVIGYLKENAKKVKSLSGANLLYDLWFLHNEGIYFDEHIPLYDVQILDPLINELHSSYSLNNISKRWGIGEKDEAILTEAAKAKKYNPKSELWRLHSSFVGPYAEQDAILPKKIIPLQMKEIKNQDLENVLSLEMGVQNALFSMKKRGIRIDIEQLNKLEIWLEEIESKGYEDLKNMSNHHFDSKIMMSNDRLSKFLHCSGVELIEKTATNKFKVDKATLSIINSPITNKILEIKNINKLRTTFCASIRKRLISGRIYPNFNQLKTQKPNGTIGGAAYGRLSSDNPNIQQQPSRGEMAIPWRSIYIPEEGCLWASNDYSQQEPRIATNCAVRTAPLLSPRAAESALRMAEEYNNNPETDSHTMMMRFAGMDNGVECPKELSRIRGEAKQIYLGRLYSMGGATMARRLGREPVDWVYDKLSKRKVFADSEEGRRALANGAKPWLGPDKETLEVIEKLDEKIPWVKELSDLFQSVASNRGYIKTESGRKCRFNVSDLGGYERTNVALNRVVQGSAGDQTKKALWDCHKAGYSMILQIHDEIALNVSSLEEAKECARIMEEGFPLKVKSKVDVEVGKSWGDSMRK